MVFCPANMQLLIEAQVIATLEMVFMGSKNDRAEIIRFFNQEFQSAIEDREIEEQVDAMHDDGCPN